MSSKMTRLKLSAVDKIIVHCSDSDRKSHDNARTIRKWHLERGFADIGYHYVICKRNNGVVEPGRSLDFVGAHCRGQNSTSIGVCLTGKQFFTGWQFRSLNLLIESLDTILEPNPRSKQPSKRRLKSYPHHYFNKNKTCPNFSQWAEKLHDRFRNQFLRYPVVSDANDAIIYDTQSDPEKFEYPGEESRAGK